MNVLKEINDTYGHMEGDELLRVIAEEAQKKLARGDVAYRLGGDEFLVFAKGLSDRAIISRRMNWLLGSLRSDPDQPLDSSAGVTLVRQKDFQYTRCLQEVDIALYRSKKDGKDMFSFYDPPAGT